MGLIYIYLRSFTFRQNYLLSVGFSRLHCLHISTSIALDKTFTIFISITLSFHILSKSFSETELEALNPEAVCAHYSGRSY